MVELNADLLKIMLQIKPEIFSQSIPLFRRQSLFFFIAVVVVILCQLKTVDAYPGNLDPTFAQNGIFQVQLGNFGFLRSAVAQPDGKIVTVGWTGNKILLIRLNPEGSLDFTFDNDGIVTTEFNNYMATSASVLIQPDGKIIVAGTLMLNADNNFFLVRYNPNGTLDLSFGVNGTAFIPIGNNRNTAQSAVLQADGKIIVAGETNPAAFTVECLLVRYSSNGSLDTTFGNGGIVKTTIGGFARINSVGVQPDGKIIAAGHGRSEDSGIDFALLRYNADGTLDNTFDGDGIALTSFILNFDERINAVALQPDGKIVALGTVSFDEGGFGAALARYNVNGTLDSTFGADGKTALAYPDGSVAAFALALQPDGKILGGGHNITSNASYSTVFRLNNNGAFDGSFGENGIANSSHNSVSKLLIQSDERIIVLAGNEIKRLAAGGAAYFDFDGDRKDDISVFRPGNGFWYSINSTNNSFRALQFGISTDKLVPADYDGDGKADVVVMRDGIWYLQRSQLGFTSIAFGAPDDVPVPADYDGDGRADIAVFRPSNGTWYISRSQLGFVGVQFGQTGDKPVAADYDGDGRTDIAVNRNGNWYIQRSTNGFTGILFGNADDKLVPADYDGDGKADIAVFRPSTGAWYLLQSSAGFTGQTFGLGTDTPTPADYDGDGKTDLAVVRNGTWYLNRTTQEFTVVQFGTSTDLPISNAFIR